MREPGIYKGVDIKTYHSEEGISNTGISLILDCPKRYYHQYLNGELRKKEEKEYFKSGHLFHTLMLEPEKFNEEFYVIDTSDSRNPNKNVRKNTGIWNEIMETAKIAANGELRKKEEKEYFKSGRLFHTLMLEPEKFNEEFYVIDTSDSRNPNKNVRKNTGIWNEIMETAKIEANGRAIIEKSIYEKVKKMACEASCSKLWEKIYLDKGCIEHSIYWNEGAFNSRLRARPDFFNEDLIIEFKTTSSIQSFKNSIDKFGYHRQAAMQIDGLRKIDGRKRAFGFFVIEDKPPYLTAPFSLDEEAINLGRKQYLLGADIYSMCLKSNRWPGYNEEEEVGFQLIKLSSRATKENCYD
jgi:hypothetical protein